MAFADVLDRHFGPAATLVLHDLTSSSMNSTLVTPLEATSIRASAANDSVSAAPLAIVSTVPAVVPDGPMSSGPPDVTLTVIERRRVLAERSVTAPLTEARPPASSEYPSIGSPS